MQITCPACYTKYTLPDRAIPPAGRKVRCKQCAHTWMQFPVAMADDEPDDFAADLASFRSDNVTEMRPSRPMPAAPSINAKPRRPLPWGWMALAASVVAVVAGVMVAREPIVNLWPPANLLYQTLGLGVLPPGAGLALQNPRSEQRQENGAIVLVVEGQIVNNSDHEQTVPRVKAVALDSHQQSLQTWTIDASAASLQPGEVATFFSTHRDPGPVAMLKLTFEVAGM